MTDVSANLANKLQEQSKEVTKPKANGMQALLIKMSDEIKKALPSMVSSERFQRVALTAFNSNQKLQSCDATSFLAAMMQSAQLGLEPNTPLGQAYLIPYGKNVQFQLGYKGMLELAMRSGKFKSIYSHSVYENDEFEMEYGLEQKLKHIPVFKNRGEVIGYYAVYKLINGGDSFFFMSKDDVLTHAKEKSKTFGSGPWQTDFDAMAKKTVIKQLLKYAPLSIEVQKAVTADETVKKEIHEDMDLVQDVSIIEGEAEEI